MDELRLLKLREYLLKNLGLNFTVNRNKELYGKMEDASKGFNFKDVDKFIDWLTNRSLDTKQTKLLASSLTIGETYFLREKKALDYLEYEYLPKLIHDRRGKQQYIKIWSAGCSSGEEPYSVAIMLKRLLPNIKDWNITLKATDINPKFLDKARKGEYTEWSFRGIPDTFKLKYFKRSGKGKYIINEEIRGMVDFSFLNLMSDDFCSLENNINSFDIILCRNVMIYFSNEGIQYVTSKFYDSLTKGGVLILSPVESTHLICSKFTRSFKDSVTVYKNEVIENISEVSTIKMKNTCKVRPVINPYKKQEFHNKIIVGKKQKVESKRKNESIVKEVDENNYISKDLNYNELLDLYKAGLLEKAENLLDSFIDKTQDPRYYLLKARIKSDKRQLVDAENLCLKAITLNKVNAEAYYLLAYVLFEQSRQDEAIESLNKSIFLEPDYALGYFLLGNIYRAMGRAEESRKNFNNAKKSLSILKSNDIVLEYDDLTKDRLEEIINSYLL